LNNIYKFEDLLNNLVYMQKESISKGDVNHYITLKMQYEKLYDKYFKLMKEANLIAIEKINV